MASPEEENEEVTIFREGMDDGVSEIFPSFPCMGHRRTCLDCEGCVQQKDTLLCPTSEITILGHGCTNIISYFLENIHKGRRIPYSFLH